MLDAFLNHTFVIKIFQNTIIEIFISTKNASHCNVRTYVSNILSVSSVTGNCAHPKIRAVCVTDACDARRPISVRALPALAAPYDLFTKGPTQECLD